MILSECPVKNRVGGVFVHVTDMPRAVAFFTFLDPDGNMLMACQ
jgi:hypothetical protein